MSDTVHLQELRPSSGRRLPNDILYGWTQYAAAALPVQLRVDGDTAEWRPNADPRVRAARCLTVLHDNGRHGLLALLNDALDGGDYPVLNAVLSTAIGVGTAGASFIFTVATTALSMAKADARVLARHGDEIWRIEEIGKTTRPGGPQPTYVLAYFLVEPFRAQSPGEKGWLLHEARYRIVNQ